MNYLSFLIQLFFYNSLETRVQSDVAQKEFQSSFTICMNICNDFKFNDMQQAAFLVAANSWLTLHAYHDLCNNTSPPSNNDMKKPEPLHMFLTGPGGTGKTQVIGRLNQLLISYNCGHQICYLAPTGGVAKMIGGMTIHKGLGIAIKQVKKGKGN